MSAPRKRPAKGATPKRAGKPRRRPKPIPWGAMVAARLGELAVHPAALRALLIQLLTTGAGVVQSVRHGEPPEVVIGFVIAFVFSLIQGVLPNAIGPSGSVREPTDAITAPKGKRPTLGPRRARDDEGA
jgi:hypothetical protein